MMRRLVTRSLSARAAVVTAPLAFSRVPTFRRLSASSASAAAEVSTVASDPVAGALQPSYPDAVDFQKYGLTVHPADAPWRLDLSVLLSKPPIGGHAPHPVRVALMQLANGEVDEQLEGDQLPDVAKEALKFIANCGTLDKKHTELILDGLAAEQIDLDLATLLIAFSRTKKHDWVLPEDFGEAPTTSAARWLTLGTVVVLGSFWYGIYPLYASMQGMA